MLKETMICIVIVIVIIFGNVITQNYTKESVSELSEGLTSLRQKISQKEISKEEISKQTEGIYEQWKERHEKLAYFIEHDELEKVETELVVIKSDIETDNYEELISSIDKSIFVLQHIKDKYAFNLQNIF